MEKPIKDILSKIDEAIASFQDKIPGIQSIIYDELQPILKQLQLQNGKLINNLENLKLIRDLQNKLEKIIVNADYKSAVNSFIESFDAIAALNIGYFRQFNKKYQPSETLPILKEMAIESTITDLVGQGLHTGVIAPISDILRQNITTGGSYATFQEQLRNYITSNDVGEGALESHTKQITTDAINQYHAQYHDAIGQDLKFNWGQYVGSLLTTSREFCILLTAKRWVNRAELPEIVKGHIDGEQCQLSKTTDLPLGMIPDTNADNFEIYRGGYNCGHQFFWVPDSSVPANVIEQFKAGPGAVFIQPGTIKQNAEKLKGFAEKQATAVKKLNDQRERELKKAGEDKAKIDEINTRIDQAIKDVPVIDTQKYYTDPLTGQYTAARSDLHKNILLDYMKDGSTTKGTSYFTGGAPAVGKGSLVDDIVKDNPGILVIDPDRIKTDYMPEYKTLSEGNYAKSSAIVHEESSTLAKQITKVAAEQNFDIVYDGVGDGGYDSIVKKVMLQKQAGKRVVANYATTGDVEVNISRALARGEKTGRYVPEQYIRDMHNAIVELMPQFLKNKLFDELNLWSTATRPPTLILSQKAGKLTIYDKVAYSNFLKSGKLT